MVTFSAFLLLFILFHGVSFRAGVLLGLYGAEESDQCAWPPGRVALFVPAAMTLAGGAAITLRRQLRRSGQPGAIGRTATHLPERLIDLLTFLGIVGAISIWPQKIAVCYAVFLSLAIFALTRLNHHFDDTDARESKSS